ncbi:MULTISPECIES: FecR domain-containing protein [unclassified Thalassospira]|uniref:FecR family protein n=1 Tax=unclassified Thalassospira TaxID=2648997 RepID=UPI001B062F0F|nr:FecR domain-containing protein [Thalassospira sp.]MBO6772035.1 FecR domain-containing protein [Thalassospira sp.]
MTEFRYPEDCQSNEDIADYWAVRLDQSDLTPAEEAAFSAWQDADPGNPQRLVRACQIWQSMEIAAAEDGAALSDSVTRDTRASIDTRADEPKPVDLAGVRRDLERLGALEGGSGRLPGMRSAKRPFRPVLAVLTCLVLVVLFGYSAFQPDPDLVAAADASVVGQMHDLPDGSSIWMEPGTRVALNYSDALRDITVLEGGIFIKVAKDASRPLRIHLNQVTAIAVGTAFSASKWGGHARVEVSEGTVDLEDRKMRLARLVAGRAAWQDADGDLHFAEVAPERVAPWRGGRWIVDDMPIDELLARIAPLMGDVTFVRDPRLGDITVSGSFDISKPHSAHDALLAAYGLEERAFPAGFRIISRK